ncbi:MAG TPA: hypothetical protein VG894_07470 [Bauldia sp.]|nr:hypothetical protein [Bauldia sp.]
MNRHLRAGVAALAFLGLVAQPMAANAIVPYCPPASSGYDAGPIPMLLVTGFFLCAGVELGRQDAQANGKSVSGRDRVHALLGCLLPFPHKHHHT